MTSPRPRLLTLGWDDRRHEACARNDIDVVAVVSSSELDHVNPGQTGPSTLLLVDDHANIGSVLAELERAGLRDEPFVRVLTSDEFAVPASGAIARVLGAAGIDPFVAPAFRDKHVQKGRLRAAGIAVAETAVIDDIVVGDLPPDWSHWPAVVKPIAGGGTGSTARVADPDEARAFLAARVAAGAKSFFDQPERKFLLESFVAGQEWYLNGCLRGGELTAFGVGRYLVTPLQIHEQGTLRTRELDPTREASAWEMARSFALRALTTLGLTDGMFHMEAFLQDDGSLVFGECAARVPGGTMPESVRAKQGIDLIEMEAVQAVGREYAPVPAPDADREVGLTFLPASPGTLVRAPAREEIAAQRGVVFAGELPPIGTQLGDMSRNTTVNLGQAVLAADTPEELGERMDELVAWVVERTDIVPPGASDRDLWNRDARRQVTRAGR